MARPAVGPGKNVVRPKTNIWIDPPKESWAEKAFTAGMAGAAVWGIGYGFSMLLNLVEHWAVFHSSVARLIE